MSIICRQFITLPFLYSLKCPNIPPENSLCKLTDGTDQDTHTHNMGITCATCGCGDRLLRG